MALLATHYRLRHTRGSLRGTDPTAHELRVLAVYCRHASAKEAARSLGLSEPTIKHVLSSLYERLGVDCHLAALRALGWLNVPGDEQIEQYAGQVNLRRSLLDLRAAVNAEFRRIEGLE